MVRKNLSLKTNNPLFSGPSIEARSKMGTPFHLVNIEDIDVDPEQPRREFNEQKLSELAASIVEYGVLCPLLVRSNEHGTYRLIAGERRLRASKRAGLTEVPVVIDDTEDFSGSHKLAIQLIENLQRETLNPLEKSLAIGKLKDTHGMSIREIAKNLGLSKAVVQRCLDILMLPDDLQVALANGASESKVLLLKTIDDETVRKSLLSQLESFTRNQLSDEIAKLSESQVYHRGTARKKTLVSAKDRNLAEKLQTELGVKVEIFRSQKNGQGKLLLSFYSDEDLSELYNRLLS